MPFKKGTDLNNKDGALPIGNDLREARKLTVQEFERLANKYLWMTMKDIERITSDKEKARATPAIEMMIISIMNKGLIEGDTKRLDFLLERTIGQAVKKIRVEHMVEDLNKDIPVEMSAVEQLEMLDKYKELLEKEANTIEVKPNEDKDSDT